MMHSIINRFSIDPPVQTSKVMDYVRSCHQQVMLNSFENIVRIRETFEGIISDEFAEQFIEGSSISVNAIEDYFEDALKDRDSIKTSEVFRVLHESFDSVALDVNSFIVKNVLNQDEVSETIDIDGETLKAVELGSSLGQTVVVLSMTTMLMNSITES